MIYWARRKHVIPRFWRVQGFAVTYYPESGRWPNLAPTTTVEVIIRVHHRLEIASMPSWALTPSYFFLPTAHNPASFLRNAGTQGGSRKAICWGALPLDPDHLNTQPEQLSTYLAPTDPTRLSSRNVASGCYGGVSGISTKGGSWPLRTDATLAADVFLTRMLKEPQS